MTILRIDASIQGRASAGSQLADLVVAEVTANHPELELVTRHLGEQPLPSTAWAAAVVGGATPESERTAEQRDAVELAVGLADELRAAAVAVLAFPLYNFGMSQHVKTWIDLVFAGAPVGTPLLEGTPTVLLITRGGAYGPGTPREGWDHNVGYAQRIIADVWGADLTVVEREFTLAGVNPALDQFLDLAATLKGAAEDAAVVAGKSVVAGTNVAADRS